MCYNKLHICYLTYMSTVCLKIKLKNQLKNSLCPSSIGTSSSSFCINGFIFKLRKLLKNICFKLSSFVFNKIKLFIIKINFAFYVEINNWLSIFYNKHIYVNIYIRIVFEHNVFLNYVFRNNIIVLYINM